MATGVDYNPWTGKLDLVGESGGGGATPVTSDPVVGNDGEMILNTVTGTLKIWFSGMWWALHVLGGNTYDGALGMSTNKYDFRLINTYDGV